MNNIRIISKTRNFFEIYINSDESAIMETIQMVSGFLVNKRYIDKRSLYIIIQELLLNAIIHGNKRILELPVQLSIQLIPPNRLKLEIQDQGRGFDFQNINLQLPENPRHLKNRGLCLVNFLSNKLYFQDNGNKVIVEMQMGSD